MYDKYKCLQLCWMENTNDPGYQVSLILSPPPGGGVPEVPDIKTLHGISPAEGMRKSRFTQSLCQNGPKKFQLFQIYGSFFGPGGGPQNFLKKS